jgi:protein-S-isoprenylcysteine O-methyltransferase Ste14
MRWIILGPVLTFLAVVAYGLLHSLLASKGAKAWADDSFGTAARRFYRLIFNAIGVLTLLPVLAIPTLLPGQTIYQLTGLWLILATLGQGLAVIILIIGLLQTDPWKFLGLRQLIDHSDEKEHKLVVNGLYRCVRHPLYTAGLLFIWLVPIMTTSLLVLNLGLTLYICIGSIFEEKRLQLEFGPSYLEYQEKIPWLIPNLRKCIAR